MSEMPQEFRSNLPESLELVNISTLCGLRGWSFYIPDYQRGYRWTSSEVNDLLEDIRAFAGKCNMGQASLYCLQPLVVMVQGEKIHVIDGQQRLTTIRLMLAYFNEATYELEYETRRAREDMKGSAEFIRDIADDDKRRQLENKNIDYFHISRAYQTIKDFLDDIKTRGELDAFKKALLEGVRFIWYLPDEQTDGRPTDIFRRLNIGKIALRDSELIKALLLNRSNVAGEAHLKEAGQPEPPLLREGDDMLQGWQQEIALQWDMVENALQEDEFWYFLNNGDSEPPPTRIDFIFEQIYQLNRKLHAEDGGNTGFSQCDFAHLGDPSQWHDYASYKCFRYVNAFVMSTSEGQERRKAMQKVWAALMGLFQLFQTWFQDRELYHYVGFLRCPHEGGKSALDIVAIWGQEASRREFVLALKREIWKQIQNAGWMPGTKPGTNPPYTTGTKTKSRPILLLHNIQTIVMQNAHEEGKFRMKTFYKFPFHLYKKEKWDVEHINPETPPDEMDEAVQREWLDKALVVTASILLAAGAPSEFRTRLSDHDLLAKVRAYLAKVETFDKAKEAVMETLHWRQVESEDEDEKNRLWNYTLLDSATNRSYKNAIFPVKRQILLAKAQGKRYVKREATTDNITKLLDAIEHNNVSELKELLFGNSERSREALFAFIPTCTFSAFMKSFNPINAEPNSWTNEDAQYYVDDIKAKMEDFSSTLS